MGSPVGGVSFCTAAMVVVSRDARIPKRECVVTLCNSLSAKESLSAAPRSIYRIRLHLPLSQFRGLKILVAIVLLHQPFIPFHNTIGMQISNPLLSQPVQALSWRCLWESSGSTIKPVSWEGGSVPSFITRGRYIVPQVRIVRN